MSPGGTAQTQTATRGPLRLRGRLLLTAAIRHDLHTTTAKGPSRSLERTLVLCLFSTMADRSVCGSALPSSDTLLLQVALFACCGLLASLLGEPPSQLAHPFDGDSHFVPGDSSSRLSSRLPSTLSRRGGRTGSLRRRNGQRTCWTSLLLVFPPECFSRYAAGTDRLSTPQSVHRAASHQDRWLRQRWPPRVVQTVHMWCDSVLRKGGGAPGRFRFKRPGTLYPGTLSDTDRDRDMGRWDAPCLMGP